MDLNRLLTEFDRKIKSHSETIASGYPQSYDAYRELVGELNAYKTSKQLILNIAKEDDGNDP